ncbi:Sister chromatid cohesion, partial [Brachionus plicatilis]
LEPLVQHIYLSDSLTANEEYKLLELDEDSLDYLLEGNSLIIRGCENDNAICCTKNSTFSFKVAEISNPLLITSNLSHSGKTSEEEVYNYLNFIQAFQIDGYWRLLDFKYSNQIMDNIVKMIEEKCWMFDKIPVKDIYQELDSIYDISILNQFVMYFFSRNEDDSNYFSIRKEKIVHFYADSILRATIKVRFF